MPFSSTGLWVPLLQDLISINGYSEETDLKDEDPDKIHMIPKSWLSSITTKSFKMYPLVVICVHCLLLYMQFH